MDTTQTILKKEKSVSQVDYAVQDYLIFCIEHVTAITNVMN